MIIRYDASVDAAYISLVEEGADTSVSSTYGVDSREVGGQVHLDFDINGRLIGIEVLAASARLPPSLLKSALKIGDGT
jgi:uncharacterized protein YuzE